MFPGTHVQPGSRVCTRVCVLVCVHTPMACGVSFLQSQISIDNLVLQGVFCHVPLTRVSGTWQKRPYSLVNGTWQKRP